MALNLNKNVIDPYNNKKKWERRPQFFDDISKSNNDILTRYLRDMEDGKNAGGVKGCRSYSRLNSLRCRMHKIASLFEEHYQKDLVCLEEDDVHGLFRDMRNGKIKKEGNLVYTSVQDYVKIFKSFWHWYQKTMRKNKTEISDITVDLDTSKEKPKFNYFTFEQLRQLVDNAKYEYKCLMWFLFDSGIRSPTELLNVRVGDLVEDNKTNYYQLNIREETSKTFGRRIKLILSTDILKKYIKTKNLKNSDYLFSANPRVVNQYLTRLGEKVLGIKHLTLYDFRHCAACYWLPRYKSESALKYRFGWKKSDMIHYYTEFLGMKDTICEDDLVDSEEKTQLQTDLEKQKQLNAMMEERLKVLENQRIVAEVKNTPVRESFKRNRQLNKELVKEVLKEMIRNGEIKL